MACVTTISILNLPKEMLQHILSYICAGNLLRMKQVSKKWKEQCTNTIKSKLPLGTKKVFQRNEELKEEVKRYSSKSFEDVE